MVLDTVHYSIFPVNPAAHLFEVVMWLGNPDPAGQRLWMPVWIPGSYLVREFARHVDQVSAWVCERPARLPHSVATSLEEQGRRKGKRDLPNGNGENGASRGTPSRAVSVAKVDKHTWQCEALPEGAPGLLVRYQVYAWDLSVRAAHLDTTHGFFNGSSVFLAVKGREDLPCVVDILPPEGTDYEDWQVATTLPRDSVREGAHSGSRGDSGVRGGTEARRGAGARGGAGARDGAGARGGAGAQHGPKARGDAGARHGVEARGSAGAQDSTGTRGSAGNAARLRVRGEAAGDVRAVRQSHAKAGKQAGARVETRARALSIGRVDVRTRALGHVQADGHIDTWEEDAPLYAFGRFLAPDYDALIDHPVEMGRFQVACFEVGGCRHEVVVTGHADVDFDRLVADLRRICAQEIGLFEPKVKKAPVSRYLFLVMAVGDGYGGLEHRSSTALICSRDDLPWVGMKGTPAGYQTFLGLAAHEYFHTWHVKRIKPARFAPYDLDGEVYTDLLWVFEGFTSYYDDLMLVRSGVIDAPAYLALMEKNIQRVAANPGRHVQSVAASSFDAWIKYYRPDENTLNAVSSYYVKGALVALCLDLLIREKTAGKKSLDDVMRLLWQRFGRGFYADDVLPQGENVRGGHDRGSHNGSSHDRSGHGGGCHVGGCHVGGCHVGGCHDRGSHDGSSHDGRNGHDGDGHASGGAGPGVGELDMPALVREATGLDLRRQIRDWAYGTVELPLERLLKPLGLVLKAESAGDERCTLGARTAMRDGELTILGAERSGAAARAGLSAGDRLVAVDGLRCTEARLKTVLGRKAPGDVVEVMAFRRDELLAARVTLDAAPAVIRLAAQPGSNPLRKGWLAGSEVRRVKQ